MRNATTFDLSDVLADSCSAHGCEQSPEPDMPFPICRFHYGEIVKDFVQRTRGMYDWQHGVDLLAPECAQRIDRPTYIYVVRLGNRIKIGVTTRVRQRIKALNAEEVIAVFPGTPESERALHQEFAGLHVTGEWFRDEEPLTSRAWPADQVMVTFART